MRSSETDNARYWNATKPEARHRFRSAHAKGYKRHSEQRAISYPGRLYPSRTLGRVRQPNQSHGPRTAVCLEERPGSAVSRVARIETAALPLGISLPLDQVDATLVAIVPCSVRPTILAAVGSGLDRCDHQPQRRTTQYAPGAYVP